MLTISQLADDTATATVKYRSHEVTFTFRPGAYTGQLARDAERAAEVVAACVTEWNIDCPLDTASIEKLPAGLITQIYRHVRDDSVLAGLGEAPATLPTG